MINSFGILLFRYSKSKRKWRVLIVEKNHSYHLYEYLNYNNIDNDKKESLLEKMTKGDFDYLKHKKKCVCVVPDKAADNLWEIPKGRARNREHSIFTAVREFEEETSVKKSNYKLLGGKITHIICDDKTYRMTYFLAMTNSKKIRNKNMVDKTEISDVKWVSVDDLLKYKGGNDMKTIADKGISVMSFWGKIRY